MVVAADPYAAFDTKLSRRIRDDDSHRRIAAALADVAVAAIHPGRRATLSGYTLDAFVEEPVELATRAAVDTLIDELEDLVDTLPRSVLDELAASQLTADLGIE